MRAGTASLEEMTMKIVHRLMNDRQLRNEMGRYSKEFVDRTFSLDRISSDADAIYKSLSL